MSGGFECLNCKWLGRCQDVTEERLKTQYHCHKWEGAVSEIVNARNRLIRSFGNAAFPTLIKVEVSPKEE